MKKFAALLTTLLSCSVFSGDIEATWDQGAFILPSALSTQIGSPSSVITRIDKFSKKFNLINAEKKVPIAIVMHGCSGITSENKAAARLLSKMGFAVFLPTYYARSNVSPICAGSASGVPFFANTNPEIISLRVDEFDHALKQARQLPFVNADTVLAYGHSLGGGTVAGLDRSDITAAIITGWPCPSPTFDKQSHPSVPQLAIRFKDDPWLPAGWECKARAFSGRELHNTTSIVLDGQSTHEVLHDTRAQNAVTEFIQKHFNQEQ